MNSLGKYEVLRKYLINDNIIKNLLTVKVSNKDVVCIFTAEKPEKVVTDQYVLLKLKELSGGYIVTDALEITIVGKDLNKLLSIKDRIIELLDDPRNNRIIKDDNTTILTSELVNGGGIAKNSETNSFNVIVYFQIKTRGVC